MVDIPPVPNETRLRDAALAHLARFSTTRQGLTSVLQRRVKRWSMRALQAGMPYEEVEAYEEKCQPMIEALVMQMETVGAVNDIEYAHRRTRNLMRSGRSRRVVEAQLRAKGIESDTVQHIVNENVAQASEHVGHQADVVAALILARKRRIGPFKQPGRPEKEYHKILAIFARNGFSHDTAQQALAMERSEAEEAITAIRSM